MSRLRLTRTLALASLGLTAVAAVAQPELPSPTAFFPSYGEQFTPHHRLVDYFEAVAEASPRVELERYGSTYEGRPLLVAYVSSPANLARREEIRRAHLQRANLLPGDAPAGDDAPAIVWLSYSVHGNEAAGSEASPSVLHALASAKPGDTLAALLDDVIVVLDPSLNPDGYTRYTDDVRRRSTATPQPDRHAWEHVEAWPGGRTNHYLFDLNRDWVWASQAETQQRLRLFRRWLPHVHADLHEMGAESHYYFAPAAEPYHRAITPFQRDFQTRIGANHARRFDREGWLYYTREVFDLLYPSYGDTYPTFNGGIGMTYEQGGSGRAGRAYRTEEGDTLTLADRIAHHAATSLSTVAVASHHADELVRAWGDYFEAAQRDGDGYAAYVFPSSTNAPGELAALRDLLARHDIDFAYADGGGEVEGVSFAPGPRAGKRRVARGDLVVTAAQPMGTLARVLLDPVTEVPDSLTYDITAWSVPTVLGLDGFATRRRIATTAATDAAPAARPARESLRYGVALTPQGLTGWQAAARLLGAGAVARVSSEPSAYGEGRTALPAGTLLFLARDQSSPQVYEALLDSLLAAPRLRLVRVPGGRVFDGVDVGSERVTRLAAPTVALVQDDRVNANAFGHLWHFFEQTLGYPVRPLPWSRVAAAGALDDVDVLLAPDGRLEWSGEAGMAVRDWVEDGGRLIALEGSAEAIGRLDGYGLKLKDRETSPPQGGSLRKTGSGERDPMAAYGERQRERIADNVPGALVEARVDRTHPIGYGLPERVFLLRTAERRWDWLPTDARAANVVGVRADPEVRGFIGSRARRQLPETLAVGVEPVGRGEVVYAADNLAYRGFWRLGMHLLTNAVFMP